ncbi:VOC family protein [Georgenia sp. AZ-5]|uniref:VOC family protein n=1 Tax=Georgenia sp. AZ-5 TaxID=3367526 RepID=UPI0037547A2F
MGTPTAGGPPGHVPTSGGLPGGGPAGAVPWAGVTDPPSVHPHPARGIDHVGVVVADLVGTTRFYVEELGMVPDGEPVELADRGVRVQFLRAGADRLELLQPTTADGPLARFLARRGEGLHHVCLEVEDIHGAVERLHAREVRMADDAPWRSPHGWAAFLHPAAAHGCAIELREHYR